MNNNNVAAIRALCFSDRACTEERTATILPSSKPVPETVDCSEVGWTAWIVLQLLSKCHDVIVNSTAAGAFVFTAANFLQQLCLSDEAVGILNKKTLES